MLELFLFINPIGETCRRATSTVSAVKQENIVPLELHFIPIVTCDVINQYIKENGLDPNDLALRNRLVETASQLVRDFKAAQFQGNKKARLLLQAEQAMLETSVDYTEQRALIAAEQVGLEMSAFVSDRASIDLQASLPHDTQLAHQMGVTDFPSAVLIDSRYPDKPALLLSRETCKAALTKFLQHIHKPDMVQLVGQIENF